MQDKKLRIFIGPCWFGKIAPTLGAALRQKGLKVTCAVRGGALARYADAEYDVIIDFEGLKLWQHILKKLKYFWTFLHKHDAFIFLYGDTLLPYNLDLPVLKLLRKKTIMWFIGSDVKDYRSFVKAAKKAGIRYHPNPYLMEMGRAESPDALRRRLKMIHRVERYADYIISHPTISHRLTRRCHHIDLPVDIHKIEYNNMPNPKPVVVHAPSVDIKKGTSYILKAVEQLKKEGYDFDFCLFQNVPNRVVRETLTKADIAIDQLFGIGGGLFAREAMAAGCAVLGGNIPELFHPPGELPIVHMNPNDIHQKLKMLLDDPELRQELGEKGRKYVEKYHDSRKVASDVLKLLSGDTEDLISYNPKG